MAMYLAGDSLSFTATTTGRLEDFDESPLGLQSADRSATGSNSAGRCATESAPTRSSIARTSSTSCAPGSPAPRRRSTRAPTGAGTSRTSPTPTAWVSLATAAASGTASSSANWSETEGNLDLFSPPGGTPDVAFDITNYDDVKLFSVDAEVSYRFSEPRLGRPLLVVGGLRIDSFLTRGLVPYLPSAALLDLVNGGYTANVFGLHLKLVI